MKTEMFLDRLYVSQIAALTRNGHASPTPIPAAPNRYPNSTLGTDITILCS